MPEKDDCAWQHDKWDAELYETGCRQSFSFIDGGVRQNEFNYCPYCGKPIKEVAPEEEDDER